MPFALSATVIVLRRTTMALDAAGDPVPVVLHRSEMATDSRGGVGGIAPLFATVSLYMGWRDRTALRDGEPAHAFPDRRRGVCVIDHADRLLLSRCGLLARGVGRPDVSPACNIFPAVRTSNVQFGCGTVLHVGG